MIPSISPLRRRSRRAGMTLMEIMIVIAILGVLMTVVVVNLAGAQDDANVDLTRTQIKKMEEALMMYSLKHKNKYPSTSEGLGAASKYFNADGTVPTDAWGGEFVYFSPGTHGDHAYEIMSLGKDGKEGGEDANADIASWDMGK